MTQPTNYTPTTDFSQQESINASGRSTVNTAALDAEFANIETTLDQTVSNLSLIQRDDGRLKDVCVEVHTISPEVLNLMGGYNLRGLWATATDYALNDICSNGAYTYVCRTAHTSSGAFDGQYWIQFGFTSGADAAAAAAAAQGSAASASGSAAAASNSAISAAASANSVSGVASSALASATTATTKAGEASASAVNAAASAAAAALVGDGWESANNTWTGTNQFSGNVVVSGTLVMGSAFESRNKLVNGNFSINQRNYVSGAAVGAGLYGHDRWKMAASGDTYTFSTVANITVITIPAGKVWRQVIDGVNLQSGTHVLSWTGTSQGKIGAGSYGASGVTGSVVGGTDLTIEFGPGTVSKVQFEEGSVATPFVNRPYGQELALCQRYCFSLDPAAGITTSMISGGFSFGFNHPVRMRAIPTLITNVTNANNVNVAPTGAQWALINPGVSYATKTGTVAIVQSSSVDRTDLAGYGATWSPLAVAFIAGTGSIIRLEAEL